MSPFQVAIPITLLSSLLLSHSVIASSTLPPPDQKSPASTRIYDQPATLRGEDGRLEVRVNIDKPFCYLGELLESLSDQSGVSVSASDDDGAAGEEMTAVLADMPLADAMENLTALLSHKGAKWQWRREGDGSPDKPFVYRLLRPANMVLAYAGAMKAQVQADFEKDAEVMIAGLDMSSDDIKRNMKQYPHLNYLNNARETRFGIETLRDAFTFEERQRLLQGLDKGKVIALKDLPAPGLKLKEYMLDRFQRINPGRQFQIDGADFSVDHDSNGIPTLWIGFGDLGAWSYLGGKNLEILTSKKASSDWKNDDEDLENPVEIRTLPKPEQTSKPTNPDARVARPRRFRYIAKEGNVALLARLQRDDPSSTALEPWDKPLGEYLSEIATTQGVIRKWRKTSDGKPVLLIEYTGWYWQDTAMKTPRLPWELVKRLRAERDANTNDSLLTATLVAGASLSEEQLQRMERAEFPLMWQVRSAYKYWLRGIATWIAEKPRRREQIVSAKGVLLRDLPFDKQYLIPFEHRDTAERVRIIVNGDGSTSENKGVPVAYRVEVLDGSGVVIETKSMPTWKANVRAE